MRDSFGGSERRAKLSMEDNRLFRQFHLLGQISSVALSSASACVAMEPVANEHFDISLKFLIIGGALFSRRRSHRFSTQPV